MYTQYFVARKRYKCNACNCETKGFMNSTMCLEEFFCHVKDSCFSVLVRIIRILPQDNL